MSTVRRVITALAVVTGLIAASGGPASAGLNLANHCPPPRPTADPPRVPYGERLGLATTKGLPLHKQLDHYFFQGASP
jgi:hypothetical protein